MRFSASIGIFYVKQALTKGSNQNTGKEIRVLTFASIPWTSDAKHAETVNAFIKNNYGLPLLYLAKHMLKLGLDEVMERYEKNRVTFYAFILTATELANECMDLELPYDAILDTLLDHEVNTMDTRDMAKKASHVRHFEKIEAN